MVCIRLQVDCNHDTIIGMELQSEYNASKNGGDMSDKTEWQRVVVLLPAEAAEDFKRLCSEQYTDMSSVGRRLILEWMQQQKASSTSSKTRTRDI